MKKYLVPIVVLLVFLLLFLGGILPRLSTWKKLKEEADDHRPISVNTITVKSEKTPVELVLPSTTQAMHATPIWARSNGYLNRFYVDIGDKVKAGELLAEIDTPEIDKELLQARADLLSASAKLDIAKISA